MKSSLNKYKLEINKMKKTIVRRELSNERLGDSLPPVLERIYLARGVRFKEELENNLEHLIPYGQLLGINKACECLAEAIKENKRILIIGDFDADGATSSALAVTALSALGARDVQFLVPNRFEYGYGLTPEIVEVAYQQRSPYLIMTVDNGIASFEGVDAAKKYGMKVVITDHHLPGNGLPPADAIVNPNQFHDQFPSKCLAGVGVVFYLMLALRAHLREIGWFAPQGKISDPNMAQFLDLVALGTVADVVPLDRNNRILVYQGLQRIRAGKGRAGIKALLTVANRSYLNITATDLGFAVAPRLNAAGRLTDMSLGIECLISEDESTARKLAAKLDSLNHERRLIEMNMHQQANSLLSSIQLESAALPLGLCLFDESWHQGVIGILASRIKEQLHRPVIVFARGNANGIINEIKGSARSIPGLHIRDVLDRVATENPGLISKFGGHAMAAGLTLHHEHYPEFCKAFDATVRKVIGVEALQGEVLSDGELSKDDLCLDMAFLLKEAGPWGQAFPEPVFDGRFKIQDYKILTNKHLKLQVSFASDRSNLSPVFEAMVFNADLGKWLRIEKGSDVTLAYRLDINEYGGSRRFQLIVEHMEMDLGAEVENTLILK
jgi:single-stranded-DNA-specific exonuclease